MYLIATHPGHPPIFHGNPQLEVPTIYKAYFLGLKFREYPHKTSILGSRNSHWLEMEKNYGNSIQDGAPSRARVQLAYKWLNSMVYGRYNELLLVFIMVHKPTDNYGPPILYGY